MRKETSIGSVLEDMTLTNQFDFSTSYVDKEGETHSYTIFGTALFTQEIEQHFFDRKILLDEDAPATALVTLFSRWKASRADAYARRAYALATKYEPLDNYDRTETRTGSSETTHGETITTTHADTQTQTNNNTDTRTHLDTDTTTYNNSDTTTNNNSDTTTYAGTETNEKGLFGVNSGTGVDSDVDKKSFDDRTDTVAHSGTITDAHSGTVADAHTGTITDAHTGTIANAHTGTITDAHSGKDSVEDGYTLRAHGNIGVTTSAAMLQEDKGLLSYDLALIAICDFIDRYTYYSEGLSL